MRPFAVTLQVVSSLLIVLGLVINGDLVLMLVAPKSYWVNNPITFLAAGVVLLIGTAFSFRWFHERIWPATSLNLLAFVQAAGALYGLLVGGGDVARARSSPMGPFDGLGGAILLFLCVVVMLGAGMLMLAGTLSLAAGRIVEKENRKA